MFNVHVTLLISTALFARELWWHSTESIMHVKVKINIVVCCQFDMDFPPYFERF